MKIAVWHTGHAISDTVAQTLVKSLPNATLLKADNIKAVADYDIHIGYGILRGMEDVFTEATRLKKKWFNVDRGYFRPNHYSGYYRISLCGTQHLQGNFYRLFQNNETGSGSARFNSLDLDVMQWHGLDPSKHLLICPPTDYAIKFFKIDLQQWLLEARRAAFVLGFNKFIMRPKGTEKPLQRHLDKAGAVLTYNSAVGWEALRQGIPVISGPTSIIGVMCKDIPLDKLALFQSKKRRELFEAMSELQMTLSEMKTNLWPLIQTLLSISDMMQESRRVRTLRPTASEGVRATASI